MINDMKNKSKKKKKLCFIFFLFFVFLGYDINNFEVLFYLFIIRCMFN